MRQIYLYIVFIIIGSSTVIASDKSTVLITGANRGLGLEFAKQYQARGYNVIGTARNTAKAVKLQALGVRVLQLDVTNQKSVDNLSAELKDTPLDILINNAGYFNRVDTSLDKVNFDILELTYAVNTLGPLRVTQALIDNLKLGKSKTVISISSGLSSISNSTGQWYAYRSSKTALNQINKIMSEEFKNKEFIFTVLSPGWVKTDMGGPNANYTPKQSISGMLKVIDSLTTEDSGKFYDLKGKTVDW
ncbi:MAG: SDR family oxidoreductase [Gammaproteobacteria bacterium]|nr:SDR family oxidoreductase [Gammaproteobacteria bacterium]